MRGSKRFKLVTLSPVRINVKIEEFFFGEVEG
jgi:hypothetical protein